MRLIFPRETNKAHKKKTGPTHYAKGLSSISACQHVLIVAPEGSLLIRMGDLS